MNETNNQQEIENLQKQIFQIENMARQYLSSAALQRYTSLKTAHPNKAIQAAGIIAHLASQNQIKQKISDEQFKNLLLTIEPEKRETRIIRK